LSHKLFLIFERENVAHTRRDGGQNLPKRNRYTVIHWSMLCLKYHQYCRCAVLVNTSDKLSRRR